MPPPICSNAQTLLEFLIHSSSSRIRPNLLGLNSCYNVAQSLIDSTVRQQRNPQNGDISRPCDEGNCTAMARKSSPITSLNLQYPKECLISKIAALSITLCLRSRDRAFQATSRPRTLPGRPKTNPHTLRTSASPITSTASSAPDPPSPPADYSRGQSQQ